MSGRLRVLAVDDEPLALEDIAHLLRVHPNVGRVMTADSGSAALQMLSTIDVDAVFLDVRMPNFDGVELARVLRRFAVPPPVVFVSAYDTAAVDAFELCAADYLMKPATRRRVAQALDRVAHHVSAEQGMLPNGSGAPEVDPADDVLAVYLSRGDGVRLLARSSILYLQAHGDYQRVFSTTGRFLTRGGLGDLERRWSAHGFVRVHRQFVVNLRRATALRQASTRVWMVTFADGSEVPVARRHLRDLRHRLSL